MLIFRCGTYVFGIVDVGDRQNWVHVGENIKALGEFGTGTFLKKEGNPKVCFVSSFFRWSDKKKA